MRNTVLSLAALSLTLLFSSCSKSDNMSVTPNGTSGTTGNNGTGNGGTGNGTNAQAKMSYTLQASNALANIAQKSTASSAIQWTSGFANPSLIKFEASQNGSEIEFKSSNSARI